MNTCFQNDIKALEKKLAYYIYSVTKSDFSRTLFV